MKVYLYSGAQKLIEKSGVGRAIYHQQSAAEKNGLTLAKGLEDADVVHINTVFPKSLRLAWKARKAGIPVVYHAHSTKEDFKNSYYGSNLFDGLFGMWIKLCYQSGDLIVTPTEYSRGLLESYGIKKRIEVVSNGIDLSYYDREKVKPGSFRSRYGYAADDKIIMSAGLTIDRKGILDFVMLAKNMPEYQFIWFGETNPRMIPKKIRRAMEMKLPNLRFPGYVSREELRDAYRDCDLFLFPSKEETEGIVVLEALAMKIPVLLRDIPVYHGWIRKNQNAFLAQNTIEFQLLAKKILEGHCESLVEQGYETARERSLKVTGQRLLEVYRMAQVTEKEVESANVLLPSKNLI